MSSTPAEQVHAFRTIIEEGFSRGNLAALEAVVAPHMVEHQHGAAAGLDGLKGTIRYLRAGIPDLRLTVEDVTTEDDKVWGRLKARGTHTGAFMGLAPTGKHIEIDVIDICRFEGGKMVEHWGVPDRFTLLEQLGALPGRPSGAGTGA